MLFDYSSKDCLLFKTLLTISCDKLIFKYKYFASSSSPKFSIEIGVIQRERSTLSIIIIPERGTANQ